MVWEKKISFSNSLNDHLRNSLLPPQNLYAKSFLAPLKTVQKGIKGEIYIRLTTAFTPAHLSAHVPTG